MKTLATLLLALILAGCAGNRFAAAQTPTPVTPGYQVCSSASGSTQCSFQPVDATHPLPVTPLASGGGVTTTAIDQTTQGTSNGVVAKGGGSIATAQVSLTATAVQVAAARAGRLAITITVAGTAVDTFCGPSGVTVSTGDLLVGTKGAAKTYSTSAAVFCVTGTTGTVTVAETF